ncbi:uncharacterized protein LOC135207384 [Macrobrachium nipponense]|uniref:uncharacterized protein LOC135207384 n=1 Tax=Macrobrachium nipponense TaxID=159736 RepID=UPI0030C83E88
MLIDRELEEVESNSRRGNVKAEFHGINKIRKGYQARLGMVCSRYDDLLVDREEIEERRVEHFRTLLNRTELHKQPGENGEIILGEDDEEPTTEQILEIINHLKNNNSAGLDEISAELLKYGGRQLQEAMAKIVIGTWRREEMPEEWEEGLFVPIHKKGDRTECGNYRGICLLTVGYKIIVLEWVMRQTPQGNGVHLGEAMCDRLASADDIDFCGENIQETDRKISIFREAANQVGLEINEAKTKILKVSRQERILDNIRCRNM